MREDWPHNWFGLWRQECDGFRFPECPSIEDFVSENSLPDTSKILTFLSNAPLVSVFGTRHKCLRCGASLPVGMRSDGVFAWPLDLPHYVEQHGVVLPNRFADHIRNLNYTPPESCDKRREELPWPSA
jgi:hypothetical protein